MLRCRQIASNLYINGRKLLNLFLPFFLLVEKSNFIFVRFEIFFFEVLSKKSNMMSSGPQIWSRHLVPYTMTQWWFCENEPLCEILRNHLSNLNMFIQKLFWKVSSSILPSSATSRTRIKFQGRNIWFTWYHSLQSVVQ